MLVKLAMKDVSNGRYEIMQCLRTCSSKKKNGISWFHLNLTTYCYRTLQNLGKIYLE